MDKTDLSNKGPVKLVDDGEMEPPEVPPVPPGPPAPAMKMTVNELPGGAILSMPSTFSQKDWNRLITCLNSITNLAMEGLGTTKIVG